MDRERGGEDRSRQDAPYSGLDPDIGRWEDDGGLSAPVSQGLTGEELTREFYRTLVQQEARSLRRLPHTSPNWEDTDHS